MDHPGLTITFDGAQSLHDLQSAAVYRIMSAILASGIVFVPLYQ